MVFFSNKVINLAIQGGMNTALVSMQYLFDSKPGTKLGSKVIKRQRKNVDDIFRELGPKLTRRAYRMHGHSFWKLNRILFGVDSTKKRKRGSSVNGDILPSCRLSMALRWMAGGDKLDIAPNHGVGWKEVMKSVWEIVDLVNACESLKYPFPSDHNEQQRIADNFKEKSSASFGNCVGCVDGMLIWIEKPSETCRDGSVLGSSKYFCGRKKKYGMILQGTCDHERRFIDFDISQPGCTSDYLTFCNCDLLKKKLLEPGFLKPGLTLYGDNAYVNTSFMTTPFKAVSGGIKDGFNFYHSQVRINIECAFGMLVHRWGCLRKPIPVNVKIPKICALVKCLCILHNYCIDERLLRQRMLNKTDTDCAAVLTSDRNTIMLSGGTMNARLDNDDHNIDANNDNVRSVLEAGHHFDDCPTTRLREQLASNQMIEEGMLPRDKMLLHLQDYGLLRRPQKKGSTSTNL